MKTRPTETSVESFLEGVSEKRRQEAGELIAIMREISGKNPLMWGPSIIGFGSQHYKYDTGREGDMPQLAFSPRKASLTIYFEGFDRYGEELAALGKHRRSVSCLYINKLADIDLAVLRSMLQKSFAHSTAPATQPITVEQYITNIPSAARPLFDELRQLVKRTIPNAKEVVSYGIIGYKIDDKRARVFISGWKDHVAMYPVPRDEALQAQLTPYVKGKGTLWFGLGEPLPKRLVESCVRSLVSDGR